MAPQSVCPGCKGKFLNGHPYSVHLTCGKALGCAMDSALKMHKANTAKKSQAKKVEIAACQELVSQVDENQDASSSQGLLDNQDMDTDANVNEVLPAQNSPSPPPRPSG